MIIELSSRKKMEKRHTDSVNPKNVRQGMFAQTKEGYFFRSREGHEFGPYNNLEEAKMARQLFIYCLTGNESDKPQISDVDFKALFNVEKFDFQLIDENQDVA